MQSTTLRECSLNKLYCLWLKTFCSLLIHLRNIRIIDFKNGIINISYKKMSNSTYTVFVFTKMSRCYIYPKFSTRILNQCLLLRMNAGKQFILNPKRNEKITFYRFSFPTLPNILLVQRCFRDSSCFHFFKQPLNNLDKSMKTLFLAVPDSNFIFFLPIFQPAT